MNTDLHILPHPLTRCGSSLTMAGIHDVYLAVWQMCAHNSHATVGLIYAFYSTYFPHAEAALVSLKCFLSLNGT